MNDLDLLLDDPEQIVSTINLLPKAEREPMFQRLLKLRPVLQTGGDLDLYSLTSLPSNAKLSAGGNLDLRSLTSLPAGFDKSGIKGQIYLK